MLKDIPYICNEEGSGMYKYGYSLAHSGYVDPLLLSMQCYAVDTRTGAKQMMGYVLLDLRSARQATHQVHVPTWRHRGICLPLVTV